ncbi:NAD-dependent epimerase/dehydratase family protein [Roseiflexus castenholzii]|uniref:NAD-dependent epimerase/dehydratase n=1 Tax=Roseiflexus castenholzii (strain DSM 13941 / HLO8) TaxID=383372 RepID=A7NQ59_ROSCS|nr:NAD-dependent epimerase/dehydratase family protein [Roseiflexus castenholzii]ABU59705.1 NAD-dependent epimerase/dehydratase [Roseiflexus castenholzii DSM 13941]
MTQRSILITGGAGFIGSHLADALIARGDRVAIIDDLSTGAVANIRHLKGHPNFSYTLDTIANEAVLAELIDESDAIVHLAAAVGVQLIVQSPVRTIETNVNGTELVLRWAAKKGKTVLLASTSEVYGKSERIPFREDDDLVLGPSTMGRWSYACSKLLDEFLALAYHKERDLPVIIARLFNTVGPRQTGRYGMVLPRFVRAALRDVPLRVYGDGQQTRCFCYVGDTVRALIALLDHPGAVGKIFNVGNPQEVSILELAQRVVRLARSSSPIVLVPYEHAYEAGFEDMRRRVPDISRLAALTGFRPTLDLDDIIRAVIAYEQAHGA